MQQCLFFIRFPRAEGQRKRFCRLACVLFALLFFVPGCRKSDPSVNIAPPPTPTPPPRVERKPAHPPWISFEQLAGWSIEAADGSARLSRNSQTALWGKFSAKIDVQPDRGGDYEVEIRPASPELFNSIFNTLTLWVFHDGGEYFRPQHRVDVRVRDTFEEDHDFHLVYQPQPGWQMLHVRFDKRIEWPVQLESIRFSGPVRQAESGEFLPETLYIDGLTLYQEQLSRVSQKQGYVRPFDYASPYAPLRENSVELDFPSRAAAFRPESVGRRATTHLFEPEANHYVWKYEGVEGKLEYHIKALDGFPRISVSWNGKRFPGLWHSARVLTKDAPVLRDSRITDDGLFLIYSQGLRVRIKLFGKTLQVECESATEHIEAFDLGGMDRGLDKQRVAWSLPLMRVSSSVRWPVYQIGKGDETLFASLIPDWWYSQAAEYVEGSDNPAHFLHGRFVYPQRWRGRRVPFRERVYLTVSPVFEQVLPEPSAPRAIYRESAHESRVWGDSFEKGGDTTWLEVLRRTDLAKGIVQVGPLDNPSSVYQITWADRLWGDLAQSAMSLEQVGALLAPFVALSEISPLWPAWNEHNIQRSRRGEWVSFHPGLYAMKTARLYGLVEDLLEPIRQEFGTRPLYFADLPKHPPWRATDYDARVLGSGTFTRAWEDIAMLMQQLGAESGEMILAPGGGEWFYSGLMAAVVPEMALGAEELYPFLPLFAARNIHPVTGIYGMGPLSSYRMMGERVSDAVLVDRMLSTQLAYWAYGRIPTGVSRELALRATVIMLSCQRLLGNDRLSRCEYWNGTRYQLTGDAIRDMSILKSQLYMQSMAGVEVWINGDLEDRWKLRVGGENWDIPPFGFVVNSRDSQIVSTMVADRRIYGVRSPGLIYFDSSDGEASLYGIHLHGSALRRETAGNRVEWLFGKWNGSVRWDRSIDKRTTGSVVGWDVDGNQIDDISLSIDGDEWVLSSDEALYRVLIYDQPAGREAKMDP